MSFVSDKTVLIAITCRTSYRLTTFPNAMMRLSKLEIVQQAYHYIDEQ